MVNSLYLYTALLSPITHFGSQVGRTMLGVSWSSFAITQLSMPPLTVGKVQGFDARIAPR